jgi:hypothetical protein
MKTKTFLLLCFFLGIGMTQLSAQNGKNGTGAITEKTTWDTYYVDVPVNCNDAVVDRLSGPVKMYNVYHYKNGVLLWIKQQYDGEVTSQKTNEVFTVKDIAKYDMVPLIGYGHCNLKGSNGTHYILTYIWDGDNDTFQFVKAVCP